MPPYNIRLFGAIEVFQNGQLVTSFRSQKTLVILAYLLSQNRLLTRAHLAGLFWPDVPQTQALGHLRRALHNLSKNLSGCLDTTRRTAAFHPNASVVVDIFQFQALVKQNSINSMAEAVALYRAPFLEGIFDPNSPELEQWMERERERWLQETIRLMQKLVDETQRKGQYDLALSYAQKLAAMAPWQEKNHYRLMQLYFKTGQPQAALSHFETCRKLLAAELEISPSPDITALYDRIRKATAVRHNLPPDPTPFIGRQKELAALHSMVANPDCRLITLVGAGGMGKTRLALELARQSVNHFLEGVRIVNLTDVVTTEGLLSTLKAVFGLPAAPGGDESAQLLNYLRDKEMLLALDNFEQLADTPDLSAAILREAAAVQLLVTSRRPLNLQEEWLFDLDGLPWPQPGETADWLTYEAPQLFGEAARRRCPRFDLKTNIAAVIKICRLVQGSPLALEMAAAACRDMPCAAIAEGIVQNLDILQTPLRNVPERHRSVQAVFNNAWVHLDEIAQTAYARLSIFRSSFATAAAAEVTGVTPQQISLLAAHSLVKQKDETRFELHDLLRRYARDKLEKNSASANEAAFRHAAYFTMLLVENGKNRKDGAHTAVTLDLGNIIAAWQWAAGHGQWHLLAQSAAYLRDYFLDTGSPQAGIMHLDEAIDQLKAARAVPERQPQPPEWLHGRLLAHKAHLLVRSGQSVDCRTPAQKVLKIVASAPDPVAEVEATYALAFADFNQGDFRHSRRLAEIGAELAQVHDLGRLAALCLNQAGRCCLDTGDLDMAQAYFERAALRAQPLSFFQYEISANINLSLVQNSRGHYHEAEALLQQALAQAEQHGYRAMSGIIYLNLGTVCFHLGRYADGQAHYQAAQRAYRQSGNRDSLGLSCHAQASVALEMGDFSAAGDGFEQALALYQETGAKHRQGIILSELCHIHTVLGEFSAAHQRLQDAFALSLETGEISIRVNLHLLAGWLALEVGDLAGAERAMAQTDALLPDNQTMEQVCLAYLAWSRFWQYRGQLAKACVFGDKALALARSQEKRKLPNCAIRLGLALLKMEQPAAARDLFAEALQIWEERNQPHLAAEARAGLALAALARDELATAVTHVEAILQFLDRPALPNSFLGLQEPGQTYLTCFRVLQAVGDGRGTAVLEEALAFLQKRAATLDETQRQSFWENIPSHRRLAAAVKEGEIKGS